MSFFDWLLERAAYCLHFLSKTSATGVRHPYSEAWSPKLPISALTATPVLAEIYLLQPRVFSPCFSRKGADSAKDFTVLFIDIQFGENECWIQISALQIKKKKIQSLSGVSSQNILTFKKSLFSCDHVFFVRVFGILFLKGQTFLILIHALSVFQTLWVNQISHYLLCFFTPKKATFRKFVVFTCLQALMCSNLSLIT